MEPTTDPFVYILAAGLCGLLAGAAIVFLIPQRQSVIRHMLVGLAVMIMIADALGYKLVSYGSTIDPDDPARIVPLIESLGPRIAFLGFMAGIISFGMDQRVKNAMSILVVFVVFLGVTGGSPFSGV